MFIIYITLKKERNFLNNRLVSDIMPLSYSSYYAKLVPWIRECDSL